MILAFISLLIRSFSSGNSSFDAVFCDCFRFHIMSRDDRTGFVYSGDLYRRSWELERESSHGNSGLSSSQSDERQDQQLHQHDFRRPSDNSFCVSTFILGKMKCVINCVVKIAGGDKFFWVLALCRLVGR